jgi:uncharacterized Zn finger protein
MTARDTGLFPAPKEIDLDCSCPDWADMCKHVASVLYGVGARLDEKPELFFVLRGVDMQEILTAASASATEQVSTSATDTTLAGADLADIFGVEIESSAPVVPAKPKPAPFAVRKKPVKKKKTQSGKPKKLVSKTPRKS